MAFKDVREWHQAMGIKVPNSPTFDPKVIELVISLIEEETREFREAAEQGNVAKMLDAMADILFVSEGAFIRLGIIPDPFIDEVLKSNMSKLGGSFRADGKYVKPTSYQPPNMEKIMERLHIRPFCTPIDKKG